ncbi:F420-dependent+glucose-6-phosphate+dehydrogenase [Methylocapsa aurea]|uniref:LLM class flavin-dependent oxidoreductase n=1 Tax=Methylocapsa aurea TaxID=663610 RepID=UPI003D187A89
MRIGVFCTYENPLGDYKACFDAQTRLVRRAEEVGFEEAWVAEHHFDDDAVSPSILTLLSYLAGVTSRVRLGSAAVLLAFRNPIQVAEDIATIDVLSNGRFDFGVAKGGPFPAQNKHFHAAKDATRDITLEALELIERLLYEDRVTFSGAHFQVDDLALAPKPLQKPIPIWIATSTPAAIDHAARKGFGIMAASLVPLAKIEQAVAAYRAAGPGADPRLALARFYYAAETRERALAEALPFIARFADRMRGIFLAQNAPASFDPAEIVERSLIGSYDEIAETIIDIHRRLGARSLLLKPATANEARALASLDDFAAKIRPRLVAAGV